MMKQFIKNKIKPFLWNAKLWLSQVFEKRIYKHRTVKCARTAKLYTTAGGKIFLGKGVDIRDFVIFDTFGGEIRIGRRV